VWNAFTEWLLERVEAREAEPMKWSYGEAFHEGTVHYVDRANKKMCTQTTSHWGNPRQWKDLVEVRGARPHQRGTRGRKRRPTHDSPPPAISTHPRRASRWCSA